MNNISDLQISIGNFGQKWLAATNRSPYFCFEADSEAALDAKLKKAVAFFQKAADLIEN
jgi:hypothetical protein